MKNVYLYYLLTLKNSLWVDVLIYFKLEWTEDIYAAYKQLSNLEVTWTWFDYS